MRSRASARNSILLVPRAKNAKVDALENLAIDLTVSKCSFERSTLRMYNQLGDENQEKKCNLCNYLTVGRRLAIT